MPVISVCGGIAVGKTTLCKLLHETDRTASLRLEEPADVAFLKEFYADRKRWAFHSRMGMLAYFHARDGASTVESKVLQDRCLHELVVFARAQLYTSTLTSEEYDLYRAIFSGFVKLVPMPSVIVRCVCPPEIALERVHRRGRVFEGSITTEYLSLIEARYDDWIAELPSTTQVVVVDTSAELDASDIWRRIGI
jgi:deoxyadenosine/deoxycytidine kinase